MPCMFLLTACIYRNSARQVNLCALSRGSCTSVLLLPRENPDPRPKIWSQHKKLSFWKVIFLSFILFPIYIMGTVFYGCRRIYLWENIWALFSYPEERMEKKPKLIITCYRLRDLKCQELRPQNGKLILGINLKLFTIKGLSWYYIYTTKVYRIFNINKILSTY